VISHSYDIYNFHNPTISFDEIFFNCPDLFPELRYLEINLCFRPDLRYSLSHSHTHTHLITNNNVYHHYNHRTPSHVLSVNEHPEWWYNPGMLPAHQQEFRACTTSNTQTKIDAHTFKYEHGYYCHYYHYHHQIYFSTLYIITMIIIIGARVMFISKSLNNGE